MKKIISLLLTLVITFALTACAATPNQLELPKKFDTNEMKAFVEVVNDNGLIISISNKLDSDYIGAKEGYRLTMKNSEYGQIEVYYFDDLTGDYVKTALETNKITLFNKTYNTAFSADKKIMMIYDSDIKLPEIDSDKTDKDKESNSDSDSEEKITDIFVLLSDYKA